MHEPFIARMRPPLKAERACKQRTAANKVASMGTLPYLLSVNLTTLPTAAQPFPGALQQSPGFPEVEPDVHLDWNSQALDEPSAAQTTTAADIEPDGNFCFTHQDQNHTQAHPSSLIWDSEGLVPRLQLPILKHQDQPPSQPSGVFLTPRLPPDMPNGPSIATARVQHPLSSTESAALTQLRAELNALFLESQNGPDLSLVPLPRQLNQATLKKPRPDATKANKLVRPRQQPRAPAPLLRSTTRRRHTTDTAPSKAVPKLQPGPAPQQRQVLSHAEPGQLIPCQHAANHPASSQGSVLQPAAAHDRPPAVLGSDVCGSSTGNAAQAVPRDSNPCTRDGKMVQGPGGGPRGARYGRSNSWGPGSTNSLSPTRIGVTQSSAVSTSYSK